MFHVYVVEAYEQRQTPYGLAHYVSQLSEHSKHNTEEEAEAVCLELERLGYDCWIEEEGK